MRSGKIFGFGNVYPRLQPEGSLFQGNRKLPLGRLKVPQYCGTLQSPMDRTWQTSKRPGRTFERLLFSEFAIALRPLSPAPAVSAQKPYLYPTMQDLWKPTFTAFAAYLKLSRGYSDHTLAAYGSDLEKLPAYLELRNWDFGPERIERFHLDDFIRYLAELGLAARSQARLISALKTYFGFLLDEGKILADPTELIRAPKLGRKIPEVLTYHEIRELLAQIDLSLDHGLRDRALLETLYACGLRVSEATSLKLTNLYLSESFVRVTGKGNKERIVPIGGEAIRHLEIYLEYVRPVIPIKPEAENIVFLNRRGSQLSRVSVFRNVRPG